MEEQKTVTSLAAVRSAPPIPKRATQEHLHKQPNKVVSLGNRVVTEYPKPAPPLPMADYLPLHNNPSSPLEGHAVNVHQPKKSSRNIVKMWRAVTRFFSISNKQTDDGFLKGIEKAEGQFVAAAYAAIYDPSHSKHKVARRRNEFVQRLANFDQKQAGWQARFFESEIKRRLTVGHKPFDKLHRVETMSRRIAANYPAVHRYYFVSTDPKVSSKSQLTKILDEAPAPDELSKILENSELTSLLYQTACDDGKHLPNLLAVEKGLMDYAEQVTKEVNADQDNPFAANYGLLKLSDAHVKVAVKAVGITDQQLQRIQKRVNPIIETAREQIQAVQPDPNWTPAVPAEAKADSSKKSKQDFQVEEWIETEYSFANGVLPLVRENEQFHKGLLLLAEALGSKVGEDGQLATMFDQLSIHIAKMQPFWEQFEKVRRAANTTEDFEARLMALFASDAGFAYAESIIALTVVYDGWKKTGLLKTVTELVKPDKLSKKQVKRHKIALEQARGLVSSPKSLWFSDPGNLLIMPMQRGPRWVMLSQEVLKQRADQSTPIFTSLHQFWRAVAAMANTQNRMREYVERQ